MAIYKRKDSPVWWIRFSHNGRRIQQSSGTSERSKALELHDRLKSSLWDHARLGVKPPYAWKEAAIRWCEEKHAKRDLHSDIEKLKYLDRFFGNLTLDEISDDVLELVIRTKRGEIIAKRGAKARPAATLNRFRALIRSILRRAMNKWRWIDRMPCVIELEEENNARDRWITPSQAKLLLLALPEHQRAVVMFALATGLRQRNVLDLEWVEVDFDQGEIHIPAAKAKGKRVIHVALNETALQVLRGQLGLHPERVFTYRGLPLRNANNRAWRKALKTAGITDFRWHDLRHTWASWLIQKGTPLYVLKEMGAWESLEMVQRYAHLSTTQRQQHARIIDVELGSGTKLVRDEVLLLAEDTITN